MHGSAERRSAAMEWRGNWTLPVAAATGYSVAGLQSYGFGPFVASFERAFGWSRAEVMAGLAVPAVVSLLLSVVMGIAIDRLGPRRVGLAGVTCMCVGFALLATATGTFANWLSLWLFLSVGVVMVQANVWTSTVAGRFDKGRGFAIAVALGGASVTAALAPLIAAALLARFEWRTAIAAMGILWLAATCPIVAMFFKSGSRTPPVPMLRPNAANRAAPLPGATLREAIAMPAFWFITAGNFAFSFYTMSLAPNLVPLLGEKGASLQVAAQVASLIGIVSLVARLTVGILLDRFAAHLVAVAVFLLPVAGCALMLVDQPSYLVLALAVASFGATIGAEYDIVFYLTSRHMGLRSFGVILGTMLTAAALAGIFAPVLAGWIHDRTGSYDLLLKIHMALMALAAVGMAVIGRPRTDWQAKDTLASG